MTERERASGSTNTGSYPVVSQLVAIVILLLLQGETERETKREGREMRAPARARVRV